MDCQPFDAVERMLLVSGQYGRNVCRVLASLFAWSPVVARPAYGKDASKMFPPSWLDFFQDG
jgi:hypothetical protein